jgi:hypothetical protein
VAGPILRLESETDGLTQPLVSEMLVRGDREETAADVDLMDLDERLRLFGRSEADEIPEPFRPIAGGSPIRRMSRDARESTSKR